MLDPDGRGLVVVLLGILERHAVALDVAVSIALVGVSAHLALPGHSEGPVENLELVGVAVFEDEFELPLPDLHGVAVLPDALLVGDDPDVIVGGCAFGEEDFDGIAHSENARVGVPINALGEGFVGGVFVEAKDDFADGFVRVARPHWRPEARADRSEESILSGTSHLLGLNKKSRGGVLIAIFATVSVRRSELSKN